VTVPALDIAQGSVPCDGETVNGDAVVVRHFAAGTLFGIVDALGHGVKAASVAEIAVRRLSELSLETRVPDVVSVIEDLHAALRGTRGAAAMICIVTSDRVQGCGVGNVELRCSGTSLPVVLTPGILGVRATRLRRFEGELPIGSTLFVFSDGISRHAPFVALAKLSAAEACQRLLNQHRRSHDDASAIVLARQE
jgi:negative regulator of sigma-B (phosphoserine phosphatase)